MKLLLLLSVFAATVYGAPKAKYRTLARGVAVTEFKLPATVPLAESTAFDLTPKGIPVLLAKGKLYSAITGTAILPGTSGGVDDFAYLFGNSILTSSHGKLGYVDENGVVGKVSLPTTGMKLAPVSNSLVAVYGGQGGTANAIYLYRNDGTFKKYVEAGGNVVALAAREDQMIFAVRGTVFEVLAGKDPKVRLMVPGQDITSLAYTTQTDAFVFTTPEGVYFASGGAVYPLVAGISCQVRAAKDASFIALCPKDKKLMRVALNFAEIAQASTEWKK